MCWTGKQYFRLTGSGSTYRMRKCRAMERQMAPTSQGFDQGGIFSRDWFSDRLEYTHINNDLQ